MKFIITLVTLVALSVNVKATHLMGGEITWECLGSSAGADAGKYIFILKVYEDCRSPVTIGLGPQYIEVWGHPSVFNINVTQTPGSPFDLSPLNCGFNCSNAQALNAQGAVHEHILRSAPVTLGTSVPSAAGWVFTWWSSARNCSISNIGANPCSHSMLIRAKMFAFNNQPASPCFDNSPAFAERPSTFICSGYSLNYTYGALDMELDSLSYEWDVPLDIGMTTIWPAIVIPFSAPYSTTSQMPGVPLLNTLTGNVSYFPPAGTAGDFVTCIKVNEFRCGVKIAEIYRDIQVGLSHTCPAVLGGGVNNAPVASYWDGGAFVAFNYYTDTVFAGDTLALQIRIDDSDYNVGPPISVQNVTFTATSHQFGVNDTGTTGCLLPPCATFDEPTPSTFTIGKIFNFSWITNCSNVALLEGCNQGMSIYNFELHAEDNYCPSPGENSCLLTVVVLGPQITVSDDTLFVNFPAAIGFQWYLNGNPIAGATGNYHVATTSGIYSVSATTAGACSLLSAPRTMFLGCNFTPTITGNTILCPNESDTLYTQQYDSYQWYKKPIGGSASPVPGATSQTLVIDAFNDAGYYFSVEVTDSGCTEMSAEVLVDSWVFLLPTVMSTGDFTIGTNGEVIVCAGDTMYLDLMLPYDTNITWYNNGIPISGATSPTLTVTTTGNYTVQGAPQICPNFMQQLGVTIEVQVIVCSDISEIENDVNIYPNPADQYLYINTGELSSGISSIRITDLSGKTMMNLDEINSKKINLPLTNIEAGIYIVKILQNDGSDISRKIVVK